MCAQMMRSALTEKNITRASSNDKGRVNDAGQGGGSFYVCSASMTGTGNQEVKVGSGIDDEATESDCTPPGSPAAPPAPQFFVSNQSHDAEVASQAANRSIAAGTISTYFMLLSLSVPSLQHTA